MAGLAGIGLECFGVTRTETAEYSNGGNYPVVRRARDTPARTRAARQIMKYKFFITKNYNVRCNWASRKVQGEGRVTVNCTSSESDFRLGSRSGLGVNSSFVLGRRLSAWVCVK